MVYCWLQNGTKRFRYDAMGNILNLYRNGAITDTSMDDLTYHYTPRTNQLEYVDDAISSAIYTVDIDDQSAGNYQYDEIGNLEADAAEEIALIEWTVYGKVKSVTRTGGSSKPDLEFTYGPDGQRISKKAIYGSDSTITTFYTRDAQGNIMAVYRHKDEPFLSEMYLIEHDIYGSSRIGYREEKIDMLNTPTPLAPEYENIDYTIRGQKRYELSNHLGNVIVVISDRRKMNTCAAGGYFEADIISAQDYYAFGMVMPDREWNGKSYRFGFNNQELDSEFGPDMYSFEYRIHDARLGRFLSVDPLTYKYPYYTPYSFAANQPIHAVELEGLESSDDKNPSTTIEAVEEGVKEGAANFAQGLFWSIGPLPAVKKGIDFYNTYQESDGGWLEYAKNATNHIPVVKDYIMADDVRNAYGESQSAGIQKTTATVTEVGLTVFTTLVLHKVSERSSSNNSSGVVEVGETAAKTGLTAPEGWITKASKKGGGTIFQDPNNPHNSIRQMPGNPDSPNPAQRNPYVIFKKHGIAYDVNGKPLRSATDPGAHIPLDQFDINKMPKFE